MSPSRVLVPRAIGDLLLVAQVVDSIPADSLQRDQEGSEREASGACERMGQVSRWLSVEIS